MGNGTNTAEWKTTQRDICRSSYYLLSKSTTERLYYFVVKSIKIKSSSNFSQLQLSTALLLKQKNKIPGFCIARTSEDPQAMESAWDKRINLFYRFWEVHSQAEWGQPAEKKTRDQNLMSKSQVITKNVNEIKLQISCCWKIQNLWMSNFSQLEVSTVVFKQQEHGKRLAEKRWPVDREA